MRIKNISLAELDIPYGCKLEIEEIFARKGITGPITLPMMSANSELLKKEAALSTLDAIVDALTIEQINPTVVKYFVKEDARRKTLPADVITPSVKVKDLENSQTLEITKEGIEIKKWMSIERIDRQIELLQKLKANLEENRKICEELETL